MLPVGAATNTMSPFHRPVVSCLFRVCLQSHLAINNTQHIVLSLSVFTFATQYHLSLVSMIP